MKKTTTWVALSTLLFVLPAAEASLQLTLPTGGTNTADPFECPFNLAGCVRKVFNTLDPVALRFEIVDNGTVNGNANGYLLVEELINRTGGPWNGFHWEIVPDPSNMPQATFDIVPFSMMVGDLGDLIGEPMFTCMVGCMASQMTGARLPDVGSSFQIGFVLNAEGSGAFRFVQHPTVPEPGTLALLGLGLIGAAVARKRTRA